MNATRSTILDSNRDHSIVRHARRALTSAALAALALPALLVADAGSEMRAGDHDDWLGADLGIARPAMREVGAPQLTGSAPAAGGLMTGPAVSTKADRPTGESNPETTLAFRAIDVHGGRAYDVALERADIELLGALGKHLGFAAGQVAGEGLQHDGGRADDTGEDLTSGGLATKGWSNNHDSRIKRTNTTSYPYRAIGTLYDGTGDCTGTLVGPRHVLTAAHCIYNRKTENWSIIKFKPGRNGANSAPYGSAGPIWYWVPQQYIDTPFIGDPADGHASNGWDFALIILDRKFSSWMGYASWSANVLNDKYLYMRGYPRCNVNGAPAGCQPKTLWGDTKRCNTGQYFNLDPSNWSLEIKTNCDGSDGQSGSSFYYYSGGTAYTIGVYSGQYCSGTCSATHRAWPNIITRITPTYMNAISWFRAAYP